MASNYDSGALRRSFSDANSSIERDEDSGASNKVLHHRDSEVESDQHQLEDIVTCPIHLGIMENPKKLQCQHAFCRKCLIKYLESRTSLVCPICRIENPCRDVEKLPPAIVEKQLIDVIMAKKIEAYIKDQEDRTASDHKVVKPLKKDSKDTDSGIFAFGNLKDDVRTCDSRELYNSRLLNSTEIFQSQTGSTYSMMDIETIRENMLKYSDYKILKRDRIKKICKNLADKQTVPEVLTFDINVKEHQLILVDSSDHKIYVYSEKEYRSFFIHYENKIVYPDYIRVFNGDLFLTGTFKVNGTEHSIFIQCNLHGKIVRQSNSYPWSIEGDLPMMKGFDNCDKQEQFYVCMPRINSIYMFNTTLVENKHYYQFNGIQPEYVAYYSLQNLLWVSCPNSRKILIVDINTGAFRHFHTEQINNAIPQMICCTDDNKIIFLDSRAKRFIWIKRRNDYILTQKLNIRSFHPDNQIRYFQTLPSSMIVVASDHDFSIFKPAKYSSKSRRLSQSCAIL